MDEGKNVKCLKCKERFVYKQDECHWDYNGINPVKIVNCVYCECPTPIKYIMQENVNFDERYYF